MIPTYKRNGRIQSDDKAPGQASAAPAQEGGSQDSEKGKEIRINGYQQVLEMLQIADEGFRSSLLRRLAQKDPELARSLTREIYG